MTKQEYASWVDKLMSVRRIDTARTTSLPVMDLADALEMWKDELVDEPGAAPRNWPDTPQAPTPAPAPLKRGERLSVYWTDHNEWYTATCKTTRVEDADGGGTQRATCVTYDATGPWTSCTARQLTYWHCLDDEQWKASAAVE